jgi:hypothetical protein
MVPIYVAQPCPTAQYTNEKGRSARLWVVGTLHFPGGSAERGAMRFAMLVPDNSQKGLRRTLHLIRSLLPFTGNTQRGEAFSTL